MEFLVYFALGFVQKSRVNHLDILDEKIKPITTWSPAFSRALDSFVGFTHWLLMVFSFLLIGCREYFGFGFKILNRKAIYVLCLL